MDKNLFALGRLRAGQKNKTEEAYGKHLETLFYLGEISWYRFEAIKLRLADNTHLLIDYAVMRTDSGILEMHDCKGGLGVYMDDARVKMKVAAEMYPFVFKIAYPNRRRPGHWNYIDI